jgi:MATE family multidrug resistance protein
MAATPAAGHAAGEYLGVRILGAPLTLAYVALREVRYGRGDARMPMFATIAANLVNVALAYLFVFVLGRGVRGAALATLIANGVELGVLVVAQRAQGFGVSIARAEHRRALWRLGVPSGLQFVLEVGSFALLSLLISLRSEAEMAAHQIAIQVIHFSFLPAWAVGEAAAVLAGQAVGADRDDLVIRVGRIAAAVTAAYTGACAVAFAAASSLIASGFTRDAAVLAVSVRLLHVAAIFQVFDAVNMVARGVLRGTGDVRFAAAVGITTAWLATPPLAWLLGWRLGLGAFGGWIGLCVEIIVGAAVLTARVERRGWAAAAAQARARLVVATR